MTKTFSLLIPLFTIVFISCNRTNPNAAGDEEYSTDSDEISDNSGPLNITVSEPFKNQPNEFCTIIRKMEVEYYSPGKKLEENRTYPKKYCLLDVCLENITNEALVINLGDSIETAYANYALIKIFDSEEETREYENKFAIKDVVYEEE